MYLSLNVLGTLLVNLHKEQVHNYSSGKMYEYRNVQLIINPVDT